MKGLVIIPSYNEGDNIENTIANVRKYAPDFDYVIINDCSLDHTREICEKQGFNMIHLPINLGIGGAVQTGYLYALEKEYDVVVQLDGDGQHNAKYIPLMQERLISDNLDMVIGSRFLDKDGFQSTGLRRFGIRYLSKLIWIFTKVEITDPTSGMRIVNKEVVQTFSKDYPKDYPEPESIVHLIKQNRKVKEVGVVMNQRKNGVSSISKGKAVYYMIKVSLAVMLAAFHREEGKRG